MKPRARAQVKTLYVKRTLKNAGDLIAWAVSQGFPSTLAADDMHVTIAFSKKAFDHSGLAPVKSDMVVPEAEDRCVVPLGEKGATVLKFSSADLAARWQEFRDAGASWDFDTYQPHVTITYEGAGVDLSQVTPYAGPLKFGAEAFEEIDDDWADKVKETPAE